MTTQSSAVMKPIEQCTVKGESISVKKGLTFLILKTVLLLLPWTVSTSYANPQEQYKYRLEESRDKELCGHMTRVFNRNFQTPWDKGSNYDPEELNPKAFGIPYDQIFERLPGVDYSRDVTFSMLLAKFPASPEFDAIHWKAGGFMAEDATSYGPGSILIAEIDLYNDGKKEWVVNLPMSRMRSNEGMIQGNESDSGELRIFPSDGFDPNIPMTLDQLVHGQKPDRQPRMLDEPVALQFRPFIYKGKTYLSAYKQVWPKRQYVLNAPWQGYQTFPTREYMNILRVLPSGKRMNPSSVDETSNTETVCRIRMIMLNNTTPSKAD